ncbi:MULTISPECIES: hypothetical protein [Crocosphaera]|nr:MULTISPECIES: hypothetical protein [Crocosphaera]EHJ13757.1 hypothetical protein CWATWH0003_1564 [Crocosphaera watsonii WH 0003]MCH2246434.1 hypothetical protein [Crocosphaera sp.]CCQ58897.1 hypothetical protein CWATWH0005_5553 [Crocosphaera watsonii WH 0005]CCQ66477.1 hypothetical protein CWATWH0402_5711 [Crocosphaera watsonii WH 0402]
MQKLLKLAPWAIAAAAAWSLGFIYNVYYGGELSFLRGMYFQKMSLAAQVKDSPRLLILGGSGAHHSLDSEVLSEKLGIPVLNMGLDGPVGLNVILPSILKAVRPGDMVLLIPEDLILLDEDGLLDRSAPFGVATGRPGLGGVPNQQLIETIWMQGVPSLRPLTKSAVDLVEKGRFTGYYSEPLTEKGDPSTVKYRDGKWWQWTIHKSISPHAVKRIKQFRQEVEDKDATLILSLPWVYASQDEKTLSSMEDISKKLSKIAPLVYDKNDYNLKTDSSLFADTHHHLVFEGRKLRSEQLAEQLKPVINTINSEQ